MVAGVVLAGCPTGFRVEPPPLVLLPACSEMDGAAALYIPGTVSGSGAGARMAGDTSRPTVEWLVANPRFVQLMPASLVPEGEEVTLDGTAATTTGILSTDPNVPGNYLPTTAQLQLEAGERTMWARVDVRELCGPNPPRSDLTVWISTRVETTTWSLTP